MSARALGIVACLAASAVLAEPPADGGTPSVASEGRIPTFYVPPTEPGHSWLWAALGANLRASYQGATPFPLDSTLGGATIAPFLTRVRVTPEVHLSGLGLVAEADTATGAAAGFYNVATALVAPPAVREGYARRVPFPQMTALELRKLYVEYVWATGAFRVGQQTSHWGLGVLTNDGGHEPRAGDFGQQQFGDLTYRALVVARPLQALGRSFRRLEASFAVDLIARDDRAEFSRGDRAFQGVVALRYLKDEQHFFGAYGVYRSQRNQLAHDGSDASDTFTVDLTGRWDFQRRRTGLFTLAFELAGTGGTATQPSGTLPETLHVARFGGAVKLSYRVQQTTVLLDGGFATGDRDPSDGRLEAFRFDRDFKVGLVLFDHVLAYQTARGAVRAAETSTVAPRGMEVTGTGGAITGASYLFPRVNHAFTDWLELYGGPLFAFTTAPLADAFNTVASGGTAVNALGATSGRYLGTEIDLGAQARFHLVPELELTLTGEGGLFVPGDAFRLPGDGLMGPVGFGRVRATLTM